MRTSMPLKFRKSIIIDDYLQLIPVISSDIKFKLLNDACVELTVPHKGFVNKLAQTFFSTPRTSKIRLDEYGSCVWKNINGVNNIANISSILKNNFGSKAEPLHERMIQFVEILKNEGYITLNKSA